MSNHPINLGIRFILKLSVLGITFVRPPKVEDYGTVAVFADLYGNLWDLVQFAPGHRHSIGATMA